MSLDDWRRQLDDIDQNTAKNIAARLEIIARIAQAKRDECLGGDEAAKEALTSLLVVRPMREKILLENLFKGGFKGGQGKGDIFLMYAIWRLFFGRSYKEQGLQRIWGLVSEQGGSKLNAIRDLASFHFGAQLLYREREVAELLSVGNDDDLCVCDWTMFGGGYWWSRLWCDDARVLVNGTLPQVRLQAVSLAAEDQRDRWWWWSDDDVARFWLVSRHGGVKWSKRAWPMDRLLFGVRISDEQLFGENHNDLISGGGQLLSAGVENREGQALYHRLYLLPYDRVFGDSAEGGTPDEMEALMSERFYNGVIGSGEPRWRLLGGYPMPLDIDAKDFFEG